jgi:Spy/CpxP family protein refolding chaperone
MSMVPTWVKATVVLIVTLAAGVAIGIAYERLHTPQHAVAGTEAHHVIRRLQHELDLDSAQQQALAAIFARHQGAIDSAWHVMRPRVHARLDSALQEVVSVLRPDQAAKYRRMVESMHAGPR